MDIFPITAFAAFNPFRDIAVEKRYSSRKNCKELWLMFKHVEEIIRNNDGIIFGGYVRDKIIHDFYARQFYDYSSGNQNYGKSNCHPESFDGRTRIPNDIDVISFRTSFDPMIDALRAAGYHIDYWQIRNVYKDVFCSNDAVNDYFTLERVIVKQNDKRGIYPYDPRRKKQHSIKLDVLLCRSQEMKNPFEIIKYVPYDFECNQLVMYKSGIIDVRGNNIMDHNIMVKNITENIVDFHTIMDTNFLFQSTKCTRLNKLIKSGFKKVVVPNFLVIEKVDEQDTICNICLCNIDDFKIYRPCCKTIYHINCFDTLIRQSNINEQCIVCKTSVNTSINKAWMDMNFTFK